jgi:hypothetical protein
MKIQFDRSSVCMGDDITSHEETLEADGGMMLSRFIKSVISKNLALIYGGESTWVLRTKTEQKMYKDVAVIAQQWAEPKLLSHDKRISELAEGNEVPELFALYRAQEDPDTVYESLLNNKQ